MILVLNAGSSSLRCALFRPGTSEPVWRAHVAEIGTDPKLSVDGKSSAGGRPPAGDHATVARWLFARLPAAPTASGHRVVHGGTRHATPVRLDADVMLALEGLVPLAPAHQPQALACIRAVGETWPDLPQVACFDTAFHRTQDRLAQLYPLPRALIDEGLVRFGFHGLSYAHLARAYPKGRILAAHLGHGSSLCSIQDGRSVATTMGFTTLDGLMMGTRSGAVDPGLVLYLIRERGLSPDAVADLLNERSGLLGVSGISDDLRTLEASGEWEAREAIDLFTYRIMREAGSLIAALGGLDTLVFTGGIGEHAAQVRAAVCRGLAFAGVAIDATANACGASSIEAAGASVTVRIVPADEEREIASSTTELLEPF
ncbi:MULTISPECIES: acetate/propionate family kinase [unclassified Methylobacterium]|uniref:acetate/propionate family kinase n=1 Tax=unclassified Methylobacterium TaxID=2615210 RepID=UPI000366BE0F|nr:MULTISPECIES: acetate/propionate family kinase [unclassified Methylobacterium]MBN4098318.1 acetate/propionate family kinase [Methylobacterium sp. OT2]